MRSLRSASGRRAWTRLRRLLTIPILSVRAAAPTLIAHCHVRAAKDSDQRLARSLAARCLRIVLY